MVLKNYILVFTFFASIKANFLLAQEEHNREIDSLTEIINNTRFDSLKAKALYELGILYYDLNISKSTETLKKAYVYSLKLKSSVIKTNILNKLGSNYYYTSDYSNSIKCFIECLREFSKNKDRASTASIHNNLAVIYDQLNDTINAIKHHKLALYIRKSLDLKNEENLNNLAQSYGNLGKTYSTMNRHNLALENYEKALSIYNQTNNKRGIALIYNNIGTVYGNELNFDKAEEYFNKAIKIYQEIDNTERLTLSLINIAELLNRRDNFKEAIEKYHAALKLAMERNNKDDVISCYEGLNSAYLNLKDYKTAYEYLQKYHLTKDSVFNEENNQQMNELLARFDSEKKDQEIQLLQKEKELNRWTKNSLVVGVILLLVMGFLLYSRYRVKHKSNIELAQKNQHIEEQKQALELHQKEIVDSINYAKRIQISLMPDPSNLKKFFSDSFVFYKPKDIVSGDFYWITDNDDKVYMAVCDSTGHGVPGAFMSLLNIGFMSEAINEKGITLPNEVFNYVRTRLNNTIGREGQKDGFDGILICKDYKTGAIQYAAANASPLLISNGEIIVAEKDRMPVGVGEKNNSFILYDLPYQKGDMLYLFTDGFADQFGGPSSKKYSSKKLRNLLSKVAYKATNEQMILVEEEFEAWKGSYEQIDDVTVAGIRL